MREKNAKSARNGVPRVGFRSKLEHSGFKMFLSWGDLATRGIYAASGGLSHAFKLRQPENPDPDLRHRTRQDEVQLLRLIEIQLERISRDHLGRFGLVPLELLDSDLGLQPLESVL